MPYVELARDSFTRTSTTTLGTTETGGLAYAVSAGAWGVANGRAYMATPVDGSRATVDLGSADAQISGRLYNVGANRWTALVAADTGANRYLLEVEDNGTTVVLIREIGTAQTVVWTANNAFTAGDLLTLETARSGSTTTVKGYRNGAQIGTTYADAAGLAGTRYGMRIGVFQTTSAGQFDDLSFSVFVNSATVTPTTIPPRTPAIGALSISRGAVTRTPATIASGARIGTVSASTSTPVVTNAPDPTNLYRAPQQVDNFLATYPELAPLAAQPAAKWINTTGDLGNIDTTVQAAAGKTSIFTVYAIPGRDSGNYSAGGFPDRASYLDFIAQVKARIGTAPAFVVFEPDALGLTPAMSASARAERVETLRQAIDILATIPNAETYIDASKWISIADQAGMLQSVDVSRIAGFAMNTSGYDSEASCHDYGAALIAELAARGISGKRYVFDSSRNGVGPLTEADRPLASPWLDTAQAWCNPPKRRVGLNPGPVSGKAGCRAALWIKGPGESDGTFPTTGVSNYFGENAPSAGTFWPAHARDLLGLTPQKTGVVGTTFGTITADFESSAGLFSNLSPGVALVGGRLRIDAGTSYANASTDNSYTLLGSSIFARLYAPPATGATQSVVQFVLSAASSPEGTRLQAAIDTVANTLYVGAESGYWDANAVRITYDPAAMAWLRWRESGGRTYLDTSPDAKTWTTRADLATPSYVTNTANMRAQFVVYKDAGTGYAEVDDVNLAPALDVSATPGTVTSTASCGALTVAPGAVTRTPGTVAASSTLGAPAIVRGAVTRTPATVASSTSFGSPTLALGAVTAQLSGIAPTSSTGQPATSVGPVTATPTNVPTGASTGSPVLVPVTVATPVSVVSSAVLGTLAVSTSLLAAPATVPSGASIGQPVALPGPVTRTPLTRPAVVTFGAVQALPGAVNATPGTVGAASSLGSPSTTLQPISLTPSSTSSTPFFGTPSLVPGPVTRTPATRPSGAFLGTLSAVPGPVTRTPGNVAGSTAFGTPTTEQGPFTTTPDPVVSTNAFGVIDVTGLPPLRATPTSLPSTASTGTPTTALGAVTAAPTTRPSASTIGTPTAAPGAVTATPGTRAAGATPGTPSTTVGPVSRTPASIASTSSLGSISPSVGPITVTLVGLPSSAVVGTYARTPGPVTAAPSTRPSSSTIGTLATSASYTAEPAAVPGTSSVGAPAALPGAVSRTPSTLASTSTLGSLSRSVGSVVRTVGGLASTATFGAPPDIVSTATVKPDGVASVSTFGSAAALPGALTRRPVPAVSTNVLPVVSVLVGAVERTPEPVADSTSFGTPTTQRVGGVQNITVTLGPLRARWAAHGLRARWKAERLRT